MGDEILSYPARQPLSCFDLLAPPDWSDAGRCIRALFVFGLHYAEDLVADAIITVDVLQLHFFKLS
jgi:hypothetical protein